MNYTHKYTFKNLRGTTLMFFRSAELTPDELQKHMSIMGGNVTHMVEDIGNDIARPVVVDSEFKQLEALHKDAVAWHNKLLDENTALKARVAELVEFIECNPDSPYCDEIISRTPAASLLLHDADVLEKTANKLFRVTGSEINDSVRKMVIDEANALRKRAEVDTDQGESE